jgi:micrococcal nuclease
MCLMNNWRRLSRAGLYLAAAAALFFPLFGCDAPATSPVTARVARVIDGDTIVLAGGEHVRYIGIDAPETDPQEPLAGEATTVNRDLVEGKIVRLEVDTSETDRYGRLLRYVWVDDVMVNLELVRRGLAEAKAYPPDTRYQALLEAAETEARQAGRGMWGEEGDGEK